MRTRHKIESTDLIHAGAGTATVITWLGLIPGVWPALALVGVLVAILAIPAIALAFVAAIALGPPVVLFRLATRGRRRSSPIR